MMFPPGRSRLATIPLATGSVSRSRATIGMALVAFRTASIPDDAAAKMASGFCQVGCDVGKPIGGGGREPDLDGDVLPLDVALLPQAPLEGLEDAGGLRTRPRPPEEAYPG